MKKALLIIAYIISILIFLIGFISLINGGIEGFIIILIGLSLFPPLIHSIESKLKFTVKWWMRILTLFILFFIFFTIIPETNTEKESYKELGNIKELNIRKDSTGSTRKENKILTEETEQERQINEDPILNDPNKYSQDFDLVLKAVSKAWERLSLDKETYDLLQNSEMALNTVNKLLDWRSVNVEVPDKLNLALQDFIGKNDLKEKEITELFKDNKCLQLGKKYQNSNWIFVLQSTFENRINEFKEYNLDLFYDNWAFSIDAFNADIKISLPNSYNEYNPALNEKYNQLGDEYKYREIIINDGLGDALDIAGQVFNKLPEIDSVDIMVDIHGTKILKITITNEEWENRDLKLNNPSWKSYLDSVEGFKVEIYI